MILFYLLSLLFGWTEYYHMVNKHLLYDKAQTKSTTDKIFFATKFLYAAWLISGILISSLWLYFLLLCFVSILRFPVMWFGNTKALFIYELLNTPLSIMLLFVIFGFGVF